MAQLAPKQTHIVLLSTDDKLYKTNTPTQFTVSLPFALTYLGNASITFEYIHFHNLLDESNKSVKERVAYFKVYCKQVHNKFHSRDNSVITLERSEPNEPIHYRPKRTQMFPLLSNYVDYLTFTFVGYNLEGEAIDFHLLPGQPTIIEANLFNMNSILSDPSIIIRVESHGETNNYKLTNYSNDFRVINSQHLNLDPLGRELEVALSEISFIPNFDLPSGRSIVASIERGFTKYSGRFQVSASDLRNAKQFQSVIYRGLIKIIKEKQTDPRFVYTNNSLIKRVTTATLKSLKEFRFDMETAGANDDEIGIGINTLTPDPNDDLTITLPSTVWSILGFDNEIEEEPETLDGVTVKKLVLNYYEPTKYASAVCNPEKYEPHVGFMYCDFIKPVISGETITPMLSTIPFEFKEKRKPNRYVTLTFDRLQYHEVSKYDLSLMHFVLRDHSGHKINFRNQHHNVLLTLHIRAKNA